MRWIVAGLFALVAAWFVYAVSPYYALYRLGQAIESGDAKAVAARVNMRAVRYSLARQIAAELAGGQPTAGIAPADAQVAAGVALALADPFLDRLLEPEGLIGLLRRPPTGAPTGTAFGPHSIGIDDLDDFLVSSNWRGFRNVYVLLPPGEPKASSYRLRLRLRNLQWKLVAVDLPPDLVRRLAEDLKTRHRRR